MTRDELEAVIRRELTTTARTARNPRFGDGIRTAQMNAAADAILAAADTYALDTYGITADRRAVLAEADAALAEIRHEAARRAGLRTYPATAIRRQEQADIPRRTKKSPT